MGRIESYLGPILVFVGVCLIGSAAVATIDWMACRSHGGGEACRSSRDAAMGAFIGAANVGLGLAVRTSRTPDS
jgi:hypothetical protein